MSSYFQTRHGADYETLILLPNDNKRFALQDKVFDWWKRLTGTGYIVLMLKRIRLPLQVYEVTIFEAEDEDSFDEDTEITEAVRQVPTTASRRPAQASNHDCLSLSGLLAMCQV